jgi:hypothetical protein
MATKEKTDKGIETVEVDPTTLPVEELVQGDRRRDPRTR